MRHAAFKQAEAVAAEIVAQGGPPKTFDKQAVALIAYLQRLGIDLFRTETPESETPEGSPTAEGDEAEAETEAAESNADANAQSTPAEAAE